MGRDRRQAEPSGEPHRGVDVGVGLRVPGALQLEVVGAREERAPFRGELLRRGRVPGRERRADVAGERARERDQAVRAAVGEPALADLRAPAVLVLEVGAAEQVGEPEVAGARADEEEQAMRLVAVGFVRDPDVAADDRLDAVLPRALVEVDHAEDVGEIGERERPHAVGGRAGDRVVDPHDPVDDRELAVEPEMDEGRLRHGGREEQRARILSTAAAPVAAGALPGVERERDQQLNRWRQCDSQRSSCSSASPARSPRRRSIATSRPTAGRSSPTSRFPARSCRGRSRRRRRRPRPLPASSDARRTAPAEPPGEARVQRLRDATAEVEAATQDLAQARARLDAGKEPLPGERTGTATGGSRLNDDVLGAPGGERGGGQESAGAARRGRRRAQRGAVAGPACAPSSCSSPVSLRRRRRRRTPTAS